MNNEEIYEEQICESCYNPISGDEADVYCGFCRKCFFGSNEISLFEK